MQISVFGLIGVNIPCNSVNCLHFSFDGPENRNVNQQILAGVQSTDGVTPVSTIKGNACFCFFPFLELYQLTDTVPFLI